MKRHNNISGLLFAFLIASYFIMPFATSLELENKTTNFEEKGYVSSEQQLADSLQRHFMNSNFPEIWNPSENAGWEKFTAFNEESVELVIGVEDTLPNSFTRLQTLAAQYSIPIVNTVRTENSVKAIVVDVPTPYLGIFPDIIRNSRYSKYIEPNLKYKITFMPNDPYWINQWGPMKIKANSAWDTTTGDQDILVAIIDTGVDYNHPDLVSNYVDKGRDWVNIDEYPMDDNGHGTHCAGIIAAAINNSVGVAGLAQVKVMAEKAFDYSGSGAEDVIAQAIIHAVDNGADILSNSWGGSHSELIHDAIKYAHDRGVLIVASAGNDGSSAKNYPAAYDEVIAVVATDSSDRVASWSNYGDWVEVAAPGVSIYSTVWDDSYAFMSGTSMACPHVSGVAALIWSRFPNMSREQVRMHLQYTVDDLGALGFDAYYGYGRINAQRAVEMSPPAHEIAILYWTKPSYIEPNSTGIIQTTILNYGTVDETNLTIQLLANNTMVNSTRIELLRSGEALQVDNRWNPIFIGTYNVTVFVLPKENETKLANNIIWGYIYVGNPVKAFVLDSAGTDILTSIWDELNTYWSSLGDQLIFVDYETLNKDDITYEELSATNADVLIISCAFAWQFSDSEIDAIARYVYEGHGLIATAGTFYYGVPNNNKFAPLFGLNETISWDAVGTDLLNLVCPAHSLFDGISNPYVIGGTVGSSVSSDGFWDSNELIEGNYLALGYDQESAIVEKDGFIFISPWLEVVPRKYHHHLQLFYNAITWSRYQKSEHDISVSLEAPAFLFPDENMTTINATISNVGLNNETNVELHLLINGVEVRNATISMLLVNSVFDLNYTWNIGSLGTYNVTIYTVPVPGENRTKNNIATKFVKKTYPLINPQDGQWASYKEILEDPYTNQTYRIGFNYTRYISRHQINVTMWAQYQAANTSGWMIINIMNRKVEDSFNLGNSDSWFFGWIENANLTIGSTINLLEGTATVTGSKIIEVELRVIECWEVSYHSPYDFAYTFWYDKYTGLWIGFQIEYEGYLSAIALLENTNIRIGTVYQHDLAAQLEASTSVWLGNTTLIKAIAHNIGLSNETNVQLELLINGTVVNSTIIAEFSVNSSGTISYRWTPLEVATYNITAYVLEVSNENVSSNNVKTQLTKAKALRGRILFDQTHWSDDASNFNELLTELTEQGYFVEMNYILPLTLSQLNEFDVLIIPQARMSYSAEEINDIQSFVDNGGGLLVLGDDVETIYNELTDFGDIYWTNGIVADSYVTNLIPHEVSEGIALVYLPYTSVVLKVDDGARAIIRDSKDNVIMAIYERLGRIAGFVNADSFMDWSINSADNMKLAKNLVDWLAEEDIIPPFIEITGPQNGSIIGNTSILIRWNGWDNESGINYYSVYLNNSLKANTTEASYLVSSLAENTNNITIIAYDWSAKSANDQIEIIVDTTPPEVLIDFPTNSAYLRGILPVNFSINDDHLLSVKLHIDSVSCANYNHSGSFSYFWNTSGWTDDYHTVLLEAVDVVGNVNMTQIGVILDNTSPEGSIVQPANMSYLDGESNIRIYSFDANLNHTWLLINQELAKTWNSSGIHDLSWNTTQSEDRGCNVTLLIYDKAGNMFEQSILVVVDNAKPVVTIDSPMNNATVAGTVVINFTGTDDNLIKLLLYIDNAMLNVTGQGSYQWNSMEVGDGQHIIKLVAVDKAGNMREAFRTVTTANYLTRIDELQNQITILAVGVVLLASAAAAIAFATIRRRRVTKPE